MEHPDCVLNASWRNERRPRPAARKVRVLFGCKEWPSGIIEIASWAKNEGLAETLIVPVQAQPSPPEHVLSALGGLGEHSVRWARLVTQEGSPGAPLQEALRRLGAPFLRRLIEFDPHLVGFRIEGGGFEEVKGCVQAVRLVSEAQVVLGGPTATSHARDVLEECGADYVFAGEAEEPFNQFLRLAWQRDSLDRQPEIPGLAYRYGGRVYLNTLPQDGYERSAADVDAPAGAGARRCLRNLVRPAAPAAVIAANRLDWSICKGFGRELDSLFFTGGRGCPGACTFCARLHGQEVRVKPARQLLDEIEAADAQVRAGRLRLRQWNLFEHVGDPALQAKRASWASIFDEDFFLARGRAIDFFRLWDRSPLKERYRLSIQTNPCSLLAADGRAHEELLAWIDRLKPMVQLGAESFHPDLLARWHKRHTVEQLDRVLDALDRTRQDYSIFHLLTDFDSSAEEVVEAIRQLALRAYRHRRMRIASSPFTIPLYDSDARRSLEHSGRLDPRRVRHFTDYESPQPGWMDALAAELADLADGELQWALELATRDGALAAALEAVVRRIREEEERPSGGGAADGRWPERMRRLRHQAEAACLEAREAQFQSLG